MEINEKVRVLREKARLTQEKPAQSMNFQRNAAWRWEYTRANPDRDTDPIVHIAEVPGSNAGYPAGETDSPERRCSWRAPADFPPSNVRAIRTISVPRSSSIVKVCCGRGNAYDDEVRSEADGFFNLPDYDLDGYTWQTGEGGLWTMSVEGDSMEPRIHDGDFVLIARVPCNNGSFALVEYEGRLLLRVVWKDDRGNVRLQALNPDYEDIHVDLKDESTEFAILGKVIRRLVLESLAGGI